MSRGCHDVSGDGHWAAIKLSLAAAARARLVTIKVTFPPVHGVVHRFFDIRRLVAPVRRSDYRIADEAEKVASMKGPLRAWIPNPCEFRSAL